jgi:hypothetical protein
MNRIVLIKTEEQFINEFGEFWRRKVRNQFPRDMDYMLGKTVRITKKYTVYEFEAMSCWEIISNHGVVRSVSEDMIHSNKMVYQNIKKHGFIQEKHNG